MGALVIHAGIKIFPEQTLFLALKREGKRRRDSISRMMWLANIQNGIPRSCTCKDGIEVNVSSPPYIRH